MLGTPSIRQPVETWAVKIGAFDGIVDEETFTASERTRLATAKSDDVLLSDLSAVLLRVKRLTRRIIDAARECASVSTYTARFGGLRRAYDLIGYHPVDHLIDPKCRRAITRIRWKRERLLNRLVKEIRRLAWRSVTPAFRNGFARPVLAFPDGLLITIAYCATSNTPLGGRRWSIPRLFAESSPLTLLCFCNSSDDSFQDFYLIQTVDVLNPIQVKPDDRRFRDPKKRLRAISNLRRLAERVLALDTCDR